MRYKISGWFSAYAKVSVTFLVGAVLILFLNDLVDKLRHSMIPGTPWRLLWLIPYYYLFYKLVNDLTKEKIAIVYDEANVYITDHEQDTETAVPLERVLKLNMRPGSGTIGAQPFRKYGLHYRDEFGQVVSAFFTFQSQQIHSGL